MSLARQMIVGIRPGNETSPDLISTFSFPYIVDGNGEGKVFSCAHIPCTKGTAINNLQEGVMMGTSGADSTIFGFLEDHTSDDTEAILATAITARVDPSLDEVNLSDTKKFLTISFPGVDPFEEGLEVYYATDELSPNKDSVSWKSFVYNTGEGRAFFIDAYGRWIHFRIEDSTTIVGEEVVSSYSLTYYNLFMRRKYGAS